MSRAFNNGDSSLYDKRVILLTLLLTIEIFRAKLSKITVHLGEYDTKENKQVKLFVNIFKYVLYPVNKARTHKGVTIEFDYTR